MPQEESTGQDSTQDTENKSFKFFALSAELRNIIYPNALFSPKAIMTCSLLYTTPAPLQTCQRIRNEASGIYYGERSSERCSTVCLRVTVAVKANEPIVSVRGIWSQ